MDFKTSPHLIPIFDYDILHMQVNTPLFILALVLVVMLCLNKLLFQPVLNTLERRAGILSRLSQQAEGHRGEVERLTQAYEADLAKARTEVAEVRQLAHVEAERAAEAIVQHARKAAEDTMDRAMTELRRDVARAHTELAQSAQRLAAATANRVLNG
jgi:F-type H+-transporting ATPase subunit b